MDYFLLTWSVMPMSRNGRVFVGPTSLRQGLSLARALRMATGEMPQVGHYRPSPKDRVISVEEFLLMVERGQVGSSNRRMTLRHVEIADLSMAN